jgi:hypothetical protein
MEALSSMEQKYTQLLKSKWEKSRMLPCENITCCPSFAHANFLSASSGHGQNWSAQWWIKLFLAQKQDCILLNFYIYRPSITFVYIY